MKNLALLKVDLISINGSRERKLFHLKTKS